MITGGNTERVLMLFSHTETRGTGNDRDNKTKPFSLMMEEGKENGKPVSVGVRVDSRRNRKRGKRGMDGRQAKGTTGGQILSSVRNPPNAPSPLLPVSQSRRDYIWNQAALRAVHPSSGIFQFSLSSLRPSRTVRTHTRIEAT